MLIDWFTVIAQIINFLILVWLLKRFLYKPILNAVEQRENNIKAQISASEAKMAEATTLKENYEAEQIAFDKRKDDTFTNAISEAEAVRTELVEKARKAFEEQSAKQRKQLLEEENHFKDSMAQRTQQEVFRVTRKAISDLASDLLEAQMVAELIRRLHALTPSEKEFMVLTLKSKDQPILVRSTLAIPESQQIELSKTLEEIIGKEMTFNYEVKPELICGIELMADGYKLSWNIDEYLQQLQKNTEATSKKHSVYQEG